MTETISADIAVIGSGMGGGTFTYAMRDSGARVLLIERGDFLPQEPENWDPKAVFKGKRYKTSEKWFDSEGKPYEPGNHYWVGGNTKVFGTNLSRWPAEDFGKVAHVGGVSPAWPIGYEDLEPYYQRAEEIYKVHGTSDGDPHEAPRSAPFPLPQISHEPRIEELAERLRAQGLHPSTLPMSIECYSGGSCSWVRTCDGFPCYKQKKGDAEVCAVRPALKNENVRLLTRSFARRLLTDDGGGRVVAAEVERDGQRLRVEADRFVASCGAVNSAALLLRSANAAHPDGLANSSGMVGRNYLMHNHTALMAVDPLHRNPTVSQKTLQVNDFHFGAPDWPYPMGNLQMLGKLQPGMLTAAVPLVPSPVLKLLTDRSIDWWIMSEDLPDPENRVALAPNGAIQVRWKANNYAAHERLIKKASGMMRKAGFPIVLTQKLGLETNSHQCGTLRFGTDPNTSVLDPLCQAHDVENLYAVDSSFFASAGATGPSLTIAAQALRVAEQAFGAKID